MAEQPPATDPASLADSERADAAFVSVYQQLRRLAQQMFAGERGSHTLQATALVNEAFLRLRTCGDETVADPARYRRAAALAMRRILIEHARGKKRQKRGAGQLPVSLDSVELAAAGRFDEVLAVDEAIERLEAEAPNLAAVVRLRFYTGLTFEETAEALGRPLRTVQREWTGAKARLYQLLSDRE